MSRLSSQERMLRTEYALAKQVPDMSRGCTIETNYGGIQLEPAESQVVATLVEKLLKQRLRVARVGDGIPKDIGLREAPEGTDEP